MLANSLYLKLLETVVSTIVESSVLNVRRFVETTAQFIHHTGHIVRDMNAALDVYRRLGFDCGTPAYATGSPGQGQPPRPVGVANTHIAFEDNFIELLTIVREDAPLPDGAELVPIHAAPEVLPRILDSMNRTVSRLRDRLTLFQGLHILVLGSEDVAASAAHLDRANVCHGGANVIQRRLSTVSGPVMTPVKFLEIDGEPVPEGRLGMAENPPPEIARNQLHLSHPNGAFALAEVILCVPEEELNRHVSRYRRYLGLAPTEENGRRTFELHHGRITLISTSTLELELPGERAPASHALVAFVAAVRNLSQTRALLEAAGFSVSESPHWGPFVSAREVLGTAAIFREA